MNVIIQRRFAGSQEHQEDVRFSSWCLLRENNFRKEREKKGQRSTSPSPHASQATAKDLGAAERTWRPKARGRLVILTKGKYEGKRIEDEKALEEKEERRSSFHQDERRVGCRMGATHFGLVGELTPEIRQKRGRKGETSAKNPNKELEDGGMASTTQLGKRNR